MRHTLPIFEIECGPYKSREMARAPHTAILYFWRSKSRKKAGVLLRFREIPWNGKFRWDKKLDGRTRRGEWYYVRAAE